MQRILECLGTFSCWGDVANVVSLLIAFIGFSWTIREARRSKTAAETARDAVAQVREDIRRIDTVSNLTAVIEKLGEIKRLHREGRWYELPDRYTTVREKLIYIKSDPNLAEKYKTVLQQSTTQIRRISEKIEIVLRSRNESDEIQLDEADEVKMITAISRESDHLLEVLVEIRSTSIGG